MKTGAFFGVVTVVVTTGIVSDASAVLSRNPWGIIVQRNAFSLRPIPPPPPAAPPEEPPAPPPNEVRLTGITTLLGKPRVFIEISDAKTKKVERPPAMLVGEKEFGVEVLAIDPAKGIVRIRNAGVEAALDFKHNGVKPASGPAAPNPPPAAPRTFVPPPVPVAFTANSAASSGSRAIVAGGTLPSPATTANGLPMLTPEQAQARIAAQRRLLELRQNAANGTLPAPPNFAAPRRY